MREQDKTQSPSYPAAFPVSRSVSPENERDLMIPVTCGLKWSELFPNCTPIGCLGRMLAASSMWGSTKRYLTWSVRATLFKHSYIRLAASAHGMSAQELLSSRLMFPTPLASDKHTVKDAMNLNVFLSDQWDIQKEKPERSNMEPAAVGGGVLLNSDSVGRDKVEVSAGGNEKKQGQGEPCGADNFTGKSAGGNGGAQSRLDGMANGFPVEMDGHKLWKREPAGVPRITEETENRAARLKTLGNAVCPPQVFPILKCIADIETSACKENCVFGELC